MDCCDLFKHRKALFASTASTGFYVFFTIFAMISPWWHQTTQVTVAVQSVNGTELFTGPEVTRTVTLVTLTECQPATVDTPELCTDTPLDDISEAGDIVDRALWKAGAVGFGVMFVALMVALLALVLTSAALLGQSHKLKPSWITGVGAIVASHLVFCLLCMAGFAAYAGVVNVEVPDAGITSLRYGFGFGLVIILWLVSGVTTVWVWRTTDLIPAEAWIIEEGEKDVEKGLDPAPSVRMFQNPSATPGAGAGAGVGAGAGAGAGAKPGSGRGAGDGSRAGPPRRHRERHGAGSAAAAGGSTGSGGSGKAAPARPRRTDKK